MMRRVIIWEKIDKNIPMLTSIKYEHWRLDLPEMGLVVLQLGGWLDCDVDAPF